MIEGLNLSAEQETALKDARRHSDEDMLELAILTKCTEALRARLAGGLQLPTLEGVTEAWRTMLTAPQLVKYGKWIDENRGTVSQLELLAQTNKPKESGGLFTFSPDAFDVGGD